MSIGYHLAELIQKIKSTDVTERKRNLLRARTHYECFMKLLDSYDMVSKSDAKLWESFLEDKDQFSTASTRDAAARRETKIARFREEKELKKKLEVRQSLTRSHFHVVGCGWECQQVTETAVVYPSEPEAR